MNMRSVYANPYKYAYVCNVPLELANIACKKQRHLEKEFSKHIPRCPECNSKKVYIVSGSYEEGYDAYVECDNCGSAFDFEEVPNSDYIRMYGDDFDPVVYFSCTENKQEGWLEACGSDNYKDWLSFARNTIIGRR